MDSVVLLSALRRVQSSYSAQFQLSAVHVNHGLSSNALDWEMFCKDYCDRLGVSFSSIRVTVDRSSGDGLEAAARRARNDAFARLEADWLMFGHHREDQAETLMFNLLRGTGLQGAGAMRMCNQNKLRPLLAVGRDEIELYARNHNLCWVNDESNFDIRHSRNFLRHEVIPVLKNRFHAATKNLAAAAERFSEAQDLLDALAEGDLGVGNAHFPVAVSVLQDLSEMRARNVLRYLLKANGVMIPSELRLREALHQMLEAAPDRHPVVVFGPACLRRRKGDICLESLPAHV